MKMTELENEVLKLDPPARARLAEVLLRSLDELSEREVEELWLDEAERRERAWDGRHVARFGKLPTTTGWSLR